MMLIGRGVERLWCHVGGICGCLSMEGLPRCAIRLRETIEISDLQLILGDQGSLDGPAVV
jgi:hypothetical protein